MKTIAIDFETANPAPGNACQIGLAWIVGNKVVRVEERLIRPRDLNFTFTWVHGITADDVRDVIADDGGEQAGEQARVAVEEFVDDEPGGGAARNEHAEGQCAAEARRLRRAAHLLRHEPDVPVLHIAQDCGFPSNAAFAKAFKQQFSMSAKAWREGGWARQRRALALFLVQLAFNALWSWLFFGWHLGGPAFAEVLLLWGLILATLIAFWRARPLAGMRRLSTRTTGRRSCIPMMRTRTRRAPVCCATSARRCRRRTPFSSSRASRRCRCAFASRRPMRRASPTIWRSTRRSRT